MKFAIQNAISEDPTNSDVGKSYQILTEKYKAVSASNKTPWEEHAEIQIDTIEQLLELSKDLDFRLIVGRDSIDGLPVIMIYDDYIE